MLTLRYFGPFAARLGGEPLGFPTRPAARLVALLATEPGRRWRREAVASAVWPEAEFASEGVSLRTALTMLRRRLGPEVVGADRERVWIEAGAVASDHANFAALLRRERLEADDERREEILAELAETPAAFLEGWDFPWITPMRTEHARAVARVCLGLARMRLASGEYEEARRLALRSLAVRPGNEGAIAVAVRAAAALGERSEALELAARAGDSPDLKRLAEEIERRPDSAEPPKAVESSDVLFDAFENGLREDAEGAVRFLLGHHSFWWRQREFVRAKALLRLGLQAELSPELRAKAFHTLGMLEYRTADYTATLAAAEQALALDPSRGLRNDARMVRASVFTEQRRWPEARAEMEDHLALMATEPRDYRTNWVNLNLGNLEAHLLRFDEARARYQEARLDFIGDEFRRAYGNAHADSSLAAMAASEGDWAAASRYADAAREVLSPRSDPFAAPLPNALALVARAALGDAGVGPRLVGLPLDPVRSGMRGVAVEVFDVVAEGLAHLGRGAAAVELIRAAGLLRSELGHLRSPLEENAVARTEAMAREKPGASVPSAPEGSYAALATWTAMRGDES